MVALGPNEVIRYLVDDSISRLGQERSVIVRQHTRQRKKRSRCLYIAVKIDRSKLTSIPEGIGNVASKCRNEGRSDQISGRTLKSVDAAREWGFEAVSGDIRVCSRNNAAVIKFELVRTRPRV